MANTIIKEIRIPKSKQRVATALLSLFENLIAVSDSQELEQIEKSLKPKVIPAEEQELARQIVGENYHPERLLELQLANLERIYQSRRELLKNSITSTKVAELIGCENRSTVRDRRLAGTIIGLRDKGVYRYPLWQFDPEGSDGVIDGLPSVLAALDVSDFTKLNWLSKPHPAMNKLTPIEMLKQGEKEIVLVEAISVGVAQ